MTTAEFATGLLNHPFQLPTNFLELENQFLLTLTDFTKIFSTLKFRELKLYCHFEPEPLIEAFSDWSPVGTSDWRITYSNYFDFRKLWSLFICVRRIALLGQFSNDQSSKLRFSKIGKSEQMPQSGKRRETQRLSKVF